MFKIIIIIIVLNIFTDNKKKSIELNFDKKLLFLSKLSFIFCVGMQWSHYLTMIQLHVCFPVLSFILKCNMPTFISVFRFILPENLYFLLCNSIPSFSHLCGFRGQMIKNKLVACCLSCVSRLTEM